MKKHLIASGFLFVAALSLIGENSAFPLTNPKAPFVQDQETQTAAQKPFLDEARSCFSFGSKMVQVNSNGYIRIIDSGREIANVYFYGKIVSMFGNGLDKGKGPGKIMKYMMLSEMMKGNGNNNNGLNGILPLMMLGKKSDGLFDGLFDLEEDEEDEDEEETL